MKVYRVLYVYGTEFNPGDQCISGGSYDLWKEHIITCSSKKRAKEIIKAICSTARKIKVFNLGEA
jgi:hypothetical protein